MQRRCVVELFQSCDHICTQKSARLVSGAKSIALTYADAFHLFGITSNGIAPGLIETDMITQNMKIHAEKAGPHLRKIYTISRMGTPEECGNDVENRKLLDEKIKTTIHLIEIFILK